MVSVSEQMSQKIHKYLKDMGLTALSSEKKACLRGQLQNIVSPHLYFLLYTSLFPTQKQKYISDHNNSLICISIKPRLEIQAQ